MSTKKQGRGSEKSRALTDPGEIRRWADERGAKPVCVKSTGDGGDAGMILFDFPGSGGESLQPISWDDWFEELEEKNLALIVEETPASGEKSNFNKLVSRDSMQE